MFNPDNPTLNRLFIAAWTAAIAAGKEVMKIMESDDYQISMKSDNSPLTYADKMAHKIISTTLMHTLIPVLSEEGRDMLYDERKHWDLFWIVDPLDGTRQFINKRNEFTINIALISEGYPIFGVIYAPALKTMYFGHTHRGSYKLQIDPDKEYSLKEIFEKSIKMPDPNTKKDRYTVLVSFNHVNGETLNYIEEAKNIYGDINILKIGSSLKMCMLADGAGDVYVRHTDTYEWDTAAAQAVLEGAGYSIKSIDTGERLSYNKENLINPYFICQKET